MCTGCLDFGIQKLLQSEVPGKSIIKANIVCLHHCMQFTKLLLLDYCCIIQSKHLMTDLFNFSLKRIFLVYEISLKISSKRSLKN